jgi:transketolase
MLSRVIAPKDEFAVWRELGQQLRVDAVRPAAQAGSGHPTSGMSAADLMAVLLAKYLRYDFDSPRDPHNDRLVFSKGHASTLLYAMFRAAGAISEEELLTYRRFDSIFEGHPTPRIPCVDVATGSLGQGLPYAVGMALAGKRLDRLPFRVWTLCGDSEIAEGSQWEALEHAAFYELDNLVAIIDVNRLGQRGETMHGWDLDSYADRARLRLSRDRDRRARRRGDRPRLRRGDRRGRPARRDRCADDQGQGRPQRRGQERLPR